MSSSNALISIRFVFYISIFQDNILTQSYLKVYLLFGHLTITHARKKAMDNVLWMFELKWVEN